MSWQLLLVISVLATSISLLLQRIVLREKKSDPIAYAIVFQLLGGTFVGIYALIKGFQMPNVGAILPNFLLMPILYGSANCFLFYALKYMEASEYTILYATRALWTIAAAVIFLQEFFSFAQVTGMLLILASVVLVSWQKKSFSFNRGMLFALLGAMTFGLGLANDSYIVRTADVPSYMAIAFATPAVLTWAIFPRATKQMKSLLEKEIFLKMLLIALFSGISAITYFSAYQIGKNAAQISALGQTSTIVSVILAIIILREKSHFLRKIIAAVVSFVGVALVL